jgi:peptidoglycan/xylan/chitin deacetylase (PgdA/CDA1 family)
MPLDPFIPYLYRILAPTFPNCLWQGSADSNAIALGFDDGPHPDYTPALLATLDRHQIRASFFLLGQLCDRHPHLVREIYQRGHWIGLHGYTHRSFIRLSPNALRDSLTQTQAAIARACDLTPNQLKDVRPPNGLFTPRILQQLDRNGYRTVMWSVVPEDWVSPGVDIVCDRVTRQVHNGANIVLHDGYCGGRDVSAIAARLIPTLRDRGYQFATIDQLWKQRSDPSQGDRGHITKY